MDMNILGKRIIRAAKLDLTLYEEVEKDAGALPQAMTVVLLSAAAAGIGSVSKIGIGGIFIGAVIGLIAWYAWAMLTYWVGVKLLPEPQTKSNLGELLRVIGFSSAPGLIRILGVIAGLQQLVFALSAAWMLVAMVVAVKCALDYKSIYRAAGVCLIGWIIQVFLLGFLFVLFGGLNTI